MQQIYIIPCTYNKFTSPRHHTCTSTCWGFKLPIAKKMTYTKETQYRHKCTNQNVYPCAFTSLLLLCPCCTHINITKVSSSQLTSQKYPRTSMSHAHDPKAFVTCLIVEVKTCCKRKLTQNWDQKSKPMYLGFNYFMCFFLLQWFHQTKFPKF
jgi:hypothetical protein